MPANQAAIHVRKIAEAIHYAHQQGTLHRDLKPSNILIDSQDQIRITDFGLAIRLEENIELTRTGQIMGTPSYMPPEQAQGIRALIGPCSDIYAIGAVLYECLTGRPPFRAGSTIETIRQVIHLEAASPRILNPGIPHDLETICLKCLAKEPHRRYGTAQLLADDLGRFLRREPILARPAGVLERGLKWIRKNKTVTALGFVSCVAVLAVVFAVIGQSYNAQLKSINTRLESTTSELKRTLADVHTERNQAELQRVRARDAEAKARRYLYAAQMVQVELARKQNRLDQVVDLLRSVIPEDPQQEDPRGFEWHHLWRLYHGEQSSLRGHRGAVRAVAFCPDDHVLASAGDDSSIRLWNTTTGKQLFVLNAHSGRIAGLSFNHDGKRLASCGADNTVRIWNLETRRELLTLKGHTSTVTSVSYSANDRFVASGSEDKFVRVWDSTQGQLVNAREFTQVVTAVAFRPDSEAVACVTGREGITTPSAPLLWNPFTGAEIALSKSRPSQRWVSFSPDGNLIATADEVDRNDRDSKPRVALWKSELDPDPETVGIHESHISQVVFSPDSRRIASSSLDRTIKVWDLFAHKEVLSLHDNSGVFSVSFSPDGVRLATGSADGTVKIWSIPGVGAEAHTFNTGPVNNVVFSPDGSRIAAVGQQVPGESGATGSSSGVITGNTNNQRVVLVRDAFTGRELLRLPCGGRYSRVQWTPDGRFLTTGHEIWNASTGMLQTPLASPSSYPAGPLDVAFARRGQLAFCACGLASVKSFRMSDGAAINTLAMPDYSTCVAISPDDRWLAMGTGSPRRHTSGKLAIHDLASGTPGVGLEEAFYHSVWDVAFSPDGTRLAAAIGDYQVNKVPGEVVVWDTRTGTAIHRLRGHHACVWGIAFNADGTRLASASGNQLRPESGEVKLWDLTTGQEVCSFSGHTRAVYGVAFSPCGRRLVTGGLDGTIRVWDGTPLAEVPVGNPLD